jgi:hypothetical protein
MNRRDLEEMRRRLAERQAAEAADHPAMLIVSAVAFIFLIVVMSAI